MLESAFLKFEPDDGLQGEAKQEGYEGQIEVRSFKWSVRQTGGFSFGSGGGVSKGKMNDLILSYQMCSASPMLMEYCATGMHFDSVTLTCIKPFGDQQPYFILRMEDVIISAYDSGGPGAYFLEAEHVDETISLNFAQVTEAYLSPNEDGQTVITGVGTWDQRIADDDE